MRAVGHSNAKIGEKLFISKQTVRWYNKQIYSKLGTSRRTEAVAKAQRLGLIESVGTTAISPSVLAMHKYNLPTIATPFLGRDKEIAYLKTLLNESNTPLLTLLAPGGMGKIRLSIELGHQLLDSFEDSVYLFELAVLNQASDIIKTALTAPGLKEKMGQTPEETLFEACRGKKMLFIFDNFEELLEGASFISQLIQNLPDARVLVTSWERLNLYGEMVYELKGLLKSGTALFGATAKAMQAHFEMEAGEKTAVQEIVSFVGGLPLAIILAASWTDTLSIPEIAEEVQTSLDLLTTEMHDIPQRQRSIRGVLAASWQKLTPKEQAVCMKTAVFIGGFGRGAAVKIAHASLPILRTLQHRSFIQKVGERRYNIHPLVRQYGLEQLEANQLLNKTHQQHLAYYTEHVAEVLKGVEQGDFVYPLNQVQLEQDNVRLALDWGIEQGDANAAVLAMTMRPYWGHRTYPQEAAHYYSQALAVSSDKRQQLLLHIQRNGTLHDLGKSKEVEADSRAALQEAEELGDIDIIWLALNGLIHILRYLNKVELSLVKKLVNLSRKVDDRRWLPSALISLANAYYSLGQKEQALAVELETLQVARELEDNNMLAHITQNLGVTLMYLGRLEEAKPLFSESLALKKLIGD